MDKTKIKPAYILNLIIFVLELLAVIWMASGIRFFSDSALLLASQWEMFKFFTIDSNILMGVIALIVAIQEKQILKGNKKTLGKSAYILKLVGTANVTLTMLVTALFLAPKDGLSVLYTESNSLLHIVNPLLSVIAFVVFERNSLIKLKDNLFSLVPIFAYSLYYLIMVLLHMNNGVVEKGYDWYGFFMMGNISLIIVPIIILSSTYGISLGLWKFSKAK